MNSSIAAVSEIEVDGQRGPVSIDLMNVDGSRTPGQGASAVTEGKMPLCRRGDTLTVAGPSHRFVIRRCLLAGPRPTIRQLV
jgi:hypothetical protein